MKAKLAALMLVAIMLFCIPVDSEDSDGSSVRASYFDLYHATGTAEFSFELYDDVYAYPLNGDGSMKSYINSPQTNSPEQGRVKSVVEGESYELYFFSEPYGFQILEQQKVLSAYPLDPIVVKEKCAVKLTVSSIKYLDQSFGFFDINQVKGGEKSYYSYGLVGQTTNLNYDAGAYYEIGLPYSATKCLYVDVQMDIVEKEFKGSPYLYIGICVISTALVGLLIFLCGRRPDFG